MRTIEMLSMDYSYGEIAMAEKVFIDAIDERIRRIKKRLGVKTAWGIVGEADRLGLIDSRELQKITLK